jgi:hypothetical protein
MLEKIRLTGLLALALLLMAPVAGSAREHEGGHGGRGYSGARSYGGGYRAEHGGGRWYIGRGEVGRGHDWDRGYRGYYHGGGPSFYFGYGAPYSYNLGYYDPSACGYYDAYG